MEKGLWNIAETETGREEFYPTPRELAERLLDGIDWNRVETVLEPSAGKGDLLRAVAEKGCFVSGYRRDRKLSIDCIEMDSSLRAVLKYQFCGEKKEKIEERFCNLRDKGYVGNLSEKEQEMYKYLKRELDICRAISAHIVHDDFLTFQSRKQYDLIVMNPPFSNGDAHLLKAIELQSAAGGYLRCILNAETIRNPYTNRRKLLLQKLDELGAQIEYVDGAFVGAERRSDVSVALVKVKIPVRKHDSEIFSRLKKAANVEEPAQAAVEDMTVTDFIGQIIGQYRVEVDAGIALIHEYESMKPHIMNTFDGDQKYASAMLNLYVGDKKYDCSINGYIRLVRMKYWRALFSNPKFTGKLTSNLQEKYRSLVDSMANYEFSEWNIQQIARQMNVEMSQGIQDTIVALFDKLTEEHTWYPECAKNIHYYNGWKTNKAHKINSKVILPANGMFSSWNKDKAFDLYQAYKTIADIEKVFDFFEGQRAAISVSDMALKAAHQAGQRKNIRCKYFDITLYKKGTMHIKFHDQTLVDRFNIYCCRKKNWLPPCYGKTGYSDMSGEERTVIDGFHGDGTEGAGREGYHKVMEKPEYFLSEPTRELPMLTA